jgi:hypothetical protein
MICQTTSGTTLKRTLSHFSLPFLESALYNSIKAKQSHLFTEETVKHFQKGASDDREK